jgi:hypothetical protein
MSWYICYYCHELADSDEAHLVQVDGDDALVCQACVDKAEDVRICQGCHELVPVDDGTWPDCCKEWLCHVCLEDHADSHTDPHTLYGVSRKDFL